MNHSRIMRALLLAGIPLSGCTSGWYQRDADREVAKLVAERKQETLGYKPQSKAEVSTSAKPTTRAYDEIPQTKMPSRLLRMVEPLTAEYIPEPLGPKEPLPEDDNFDFVPESYATYSATVERMGPPAPGVSYESLDLLRSIEYAVGHAREYQDRMEDLYLAALDVTLERHLFAPRPFAETTFQYDGSQGGRQRTVQPNDRRYQSAVSAINRVGVRQQLPYGGTVEASQLVELVDALNSTTADGDEATTALEATIPILRGAGMVNLEPLISSERDLVYAVRAFETYRRSFSVNIASQFFRLVSQQQSIENRRQNYENLKLLSERSIAMFNAGGRVSFLDVQRARQNLLNAENSLVDSINTYQASLDSFKIAVGMPVDADLEIVPVQLEVDIPDLEANAPELATRYRLDLQTARDRIDDARRNVSNAKNGLLPEVNLFGGASVGNMVDDPAYEYNSDSWGYNAGVRIDWPIDQVQERNIYRRSLVQLERARRSFVTAREQVISDVRQVTRNIRLAMITLEIQKRSVELNQRRLDLANERLTQGKAQVLDVVDAQSALLNAQDAYDRARANLQTQILQYLRDTGTLRIDPAAGALGRAMDRASVLANDARLMDDLERKLDDLEKQ